MTVGEIVAVVVGTVAALWIVTSAFRTVVLPRPERVWLTSAAFANAIQHFENELAQFELRIPASTPIQFPELAVGGGDQDGTTDDPHVAAQMPREGTIPAAPRASERHRPGGQVGRLSPA